MRKTRYSERPLDEVAIGAAFVAPSFSVLDYGLFAEAVRAEYPNTSTQPPMPVSPSGALHFSFPQLPRVWYSSADENFVVQLQQNRIIVNWRTVNGDGRYPGFDELFSRFNGVVAILNELYGERPLGLQFQEYELTYVNVIEQEFLDEMGEPFFGWEAQDWRTFLPSPQSRNAQFMFEFPEKKARVRASLNPGFHVVLQRPILNLVIEVSGFQTSSHEWFIGAHDLAHQSFRELVVARIRDAWGMVTR